MKRPGLTLALLGCTAAAQAGILTTVNLAEVAAFQQGLSVQTFENVPTRTPYITDAYPATHVPLRPEAQVYDQVPDFRFSSGFTPGEVMAGLIHLLAGDDDAGGGNTVLAGLTPENATDFSRSEMLEGFLPARVSSLGFWVSPGLGTVQVTFLNTNFAFDKSVDEEIFESVTVQAGQFVGLTRDRADIGGFKVVALSDRGFAVDDLSYGGAGDTGTVPEPAAAWLVALGLLGSGVATRQRRRTHRPDHPAAAASA